MIHIINYYSKHTTTNHHIEPHICTYYITLRTYANDLFMNLTKRKTYLNRDKCFGMIEMKHLNFKNESETVNFLKIKMPNYYVESEIEQISIYTFTCTCYMYKSIENCIIYISKRETPNFSKPTVP